MINYRRISEETSLVYKFSKGCWLIKCEFVNTFHHNCVAPLDTPLRGLEWLGQYCAERFLPLGLGTASYLCNLFAEIFH